MLQHSYSKGGSCSTMYFSITLLLRLILLATVVSICLGSPVPSGGGSENARIESSSNISNTVYRYFNPSQTPQVHERRKVKRTLKRLKFWGKEKKEKEKDDEMVVLGYAYWGPPQRR
ncbi:hypothetical protein J3R30DRAFT_2097505 [Lentinula aciculospora]|uniref:Uncharacterized protein n=1 Tax=Lentinula aciculospora TaxID=153920 RepID=A0A9W9AG52_9AGAR|nr:hypothetical protein J3R30DRAFT_2097505 [Lentinula aciculospora]